MLLPKVIDAGMRSKPVHKQRKKSRKSNTSKAIPVDLAHLSSQRLFLPACALGGSEILEIYGLLDDTSNDYTYTPQRLSDSQLARPSDSDERTARMRPDPFQQKRECRADRDQVFLALLASQARRSISYISSRSNEHSFIPAFHITFLE